MERHNPGFRRSRRRSYIFYWVFRLSTLAPRIFPLVAALAFTLSYAAASEVVVPRVRSGAADFRLVKAAGGLENPWGLAFLPDGRMLVTERPGRLLLLGASDARTVVAGLPRVDARGQGGLLDVAVDPAFGENRYVYLTYAAPGPNGTSGTALARARLEENRLAGFEVLFETPRKTSSSIHYGSRIVFGRDGSLYVSLGERGDRDRARDLGDHRGKVLRLKADGSVPPDNPFAARQGALREIFTYGHRNVQGMAVHPETGAIWAHEHGPRGGDEINVLKAGADYGWPLVTYGKEYVGGSIGEGVSKPGVEEPLLQWTPSIAPSGMAFYDGDRFPGWKGNLFVGALAGEHLRRVVLRGDRVVSEEVLLKGRIGRVRDVRQGPDGLLYLLTDERNGALYRLEPAD